MTNFGTDRGLQLEHIAAEMSSPTQYHFDPASQAVISGLPAVHLSHQKASAAISSASIAVANSIEHGRTATRNGLTYDQFLAGLMYPEETMLASQYLYFDHVVFNPEPGSPPRASMTQGRAFVTNHRLLLLSAENYQGLNLTALFPGQDKRPTGYTISGKASDVLHYQSIPLAGIYSAELNASVGVQSSSNVFGIRPCCCLANLSCFGGDSCQKQWENPGGGVPVALATNERTLTMGVAMPPWGHRYMVQMHLNMGMSLSLVKDYIVALSRFAPNMISMPQKAAF